MRSVGRIYVGSAWGCWEPRRNFAAISMLTVASVVDFCCVNFNGGMISVDCGCSLLFDRS